MSHVLVIKLTQTYSLVVPTMSNNERCFFVMTKVYFLKNLKGDIRLGRTKGTARYSPLCVWVGWRKGELNTT